MLNMFWAMLKTQLDWLLSRSKAFGAAAAAGTASAVMEAFEQTYSITIPLEYKAAIIGGIAGFFTERVPNKQVAEEPKV